MSANMGPSLFGKMRARIPAGPSHQAWSAALARLWNQRPDRRVSPHPRGLDWL